MNVKNALLQLHQKPIAYYPVYRKISGSTTAGVLLSQLMYWWSACKGREFYKTDAEIMEETMLTPGELRTAKIRIKKLSFVKTKVKGIPAKTYYLIDAQDLFSQIYKHSFVESTKLDEQNRQDSDSENDNTNTENTSKTTSENNTVRDFDKFFDWFWETYDKGINRHKCEMALSDTDYAEREIILKQLPLYVKSTPDKKYRVAPLKWIEGKRWNDEIIIDTPARVAPIRPISGIPAWAQGQRASAAEFDAVLAKIQKR